MNVKDGLLLPGEDTSELVEKARVVEAGTALKTVLESGFYRLQDNYPDAPAQFPPDWGQMIVSRSSDTIAQMIFDAFSSRMVFRTGRSIGHAVEAWEEWKEVGSPTPNPNILVGGDFRAGHVVNQRGIVSGAVVQPGAYFIDMWKDEGSGLTLHLHGEGISYAPMGEGGIYTIIENGSALMGKPVTVSVEVEGHIYSVSTPALDTIYQEFPCGNIRVHQSGAHLFVVLRIPHKIINRAKLEMGSVSTLHLDPPQNYGMELLKCQRYFLRIGHGNYTPIGVGNMISSSVANCYMPLPTSMRMHPTIQYGGAIVMRNGSISSGVISNIVTDVMRDGAIVLKIMVAGATPGGSVVEVFTEPTGYIELSAEL